ncbi:MAG: aldehyde dehydrogenase family protein [Rubrivivax sp.]|nr:aldehyde dehydrogenase family protein [Rubrivivax sp.]
MAFKLTYSTMFDPPSELHERFDAAMAALQPQLGRSHALYIDGEDRASERTRPNHSPTDGRRLLGHFAAASARDVQAAVAAAARAFPAWRATPAAQRLRLMRRVAALIEERVYTIAAALTLEVGKNRMEALGETQETADFFSSYCDEWERNAGYDHALPNDPLAGYTSRNRSVMKPYGVWAVLTPFNFPFALAGGPVAAALVAGNTVVLKSASDTPWSGRLLADCLHDAGVPAGVFNFLSGSSADLGDALVAHPQIAGATFTGSVAVGRDLLSRMSGGPYPRPCIAEMGGKNACIVTARADLDRAATGIVRSAFGMGGQKCSALSRLYVHEAVADPLVALLRERIDALVIGDPAQRSVYLGPVTTAGAVANYKAFSAQLREQGAHIVSGGRVLDDGALAHGQFVAPTLAEAPAAHPLWEVEMFLPILMLHRVASNDEAMQLANRSDLGLTAGFYGAADEVPWFFDHIEAGVLYANRPQGATTGAWPGYQPFGGWKGSGSTGKAIASFYYLAQYLREQSQTLVE